MMSRTAFLIVALAALTVVTGARASDAPAWEQVLKLQLLDEHRCELNFLTGTRQTELGNRIAIETRAHCIDGRAFDVTTSPGGDKFEIRECGATAC